VRAIVPAGSVVLRELTSRDAEQAWAAHRELGSEGFPFLLGAVAGEPWEVSLGRFALQRAGVGLADDQVASTFLVGDLDGDVVGRVAVRHRLTPRLALSGGHIGYAVRPAWRARGLATAMLREALTVAAAIGVTEALLTCDPANVASAAVIERCGGKLQDVVTLPETGAPKRRYLVPTAT